MTKIVKLHKRDKKQETTKTTHKATNKAKHKMTKNKKHKRDKKETQNHKNMRQTTKVRLKKNNKTKYYKNETRNDKRTMSNVIFYLMIKMTIRDKTKKRQNITKTRHKMTKVH